MYKIKIFNYGFVIQRFNLQVIGSSFVASKDLVLLQPNKNFMKKATLLALFFTVVSFSQTNSGIFKDEDVWLLVQDNKAPSNATKSIMYSSLK